MKVRLFFGILLGLSSFCVAALADEPVRIEIDSSWSGLGTPGEGMVVITERNGKYTAQGQRVSAKAVSELLAAIDAPPAYYPSLQECGIDNEWIEREFAKGLEEYTHRKITQLSPKQVELFRSKISDTSSADVAFFELFKGFHTDDYPSMSVTVKKANGQYGVQSNSQYPFMLPWAGTDRPRGIYSCRISRAIAALLPSKFPNKSRLGLDHYFRWQLTEQVMDSIKPQWDMLDTEFKVGPEVAPIFAKYTPVKSQISNISSIDLEGSEAWNALLRSSAFLPNLQFGVSLTLKKGKLNGVEALLANLPKYGQLVLTVPWLHKFLEEHPNSTAELRYVDGRSLSLKALKNITEDMQGHGKPELAKLVLDNAEGVAFLEVNDGPGHWSRLTVFPNRQVLLWHFQGDKVLGLPASEFNAWDYYGWRSVGILIEPDGSIAK